MTPNYAPRVIHASTLPDEALEVETIEGPRIISGDPQIRGLTICETDSYEIGLWQHATGITTDVEHDEAFVVLSGRVIIVIEDGPTLDASPGDLVLLPAGARTTWTVQETLRKVYFLHG